MDKLRQYEIFLKKAKGDYKIAEKNANDPEIDTEIIYFHLQQCVEKLLKSLLSLNNVDFPRIHDLEELVEILKDNGIELPDYVDDFTKLTDFAVEFRYDFIIEEFSPPDNYLSVLKDFINFVEEEVTTRLQ